MPVMFPKTYNIRKSTEGRYIKGRWVDDGKKPTTFTADVQPLNSYEISRLDIGDRGIGKIKIYTDDELNVSDKVSQTPGDYVQYDDYWYEVLFKDKHVGIMPHKKYIAEFRKNESL